MEPNNNNQQPTDIFEPLAATNVSNPEEIPPTPAFTPTPPPFNPSPMPGTQQPINNQSSKSGFQMPSKKIIFAIAGGIALLLIIIAVVAVLGSSSNKEAEDTTPAVSDQSLVPTPASATGLQQTNTSISQDVSGIDNAKDFPATRLDDKTLGL